VHLTYCFARPTHAYLDFNAREDFEREIVVKVNAPELVRAELGRPLHLKPAQPLSFVKLAA